MYYTLHNMHSLNTVLLLDVFYNMAPSLSYLGVTRRKCLCARAL